jgi:SAM-dependent methyltransferase
MNAAQSDGGGQRNVGYGAESYGDTYADVYDSWYALGEETDAAVEYLADRAAGRSILELGVGTGRLAIPLARRGLDVWGVDASKAMLDRLTSKPGGEAVRTFLGDITRVEPPPEAPTFGLVFAAYNTFFLLEDETAQRSCLTRIADIVEVGGTMVLDVFVPPAMVAPSGSIEVSDVTPDRLVLRAYRGSRDGKRFEGHHVEFTEDAGVRLRPWRFSALQPRQVDELASAVGWRLVSRSSGWRDEPFEPSCRRHVSTYERT